MKIMMIDSLIGNDYSVCLCNGFNPSDVNLNLIVPKNRTIIANKPFNVFYLSPTKEKKNKIIKLIKYLKYFFDLYNLIKRVKPNIIHYQFFRRKSEIFFYYFLKLKGNNLVFTAHNVFPHEKKRYDYFLKSIIYKNSTAIIVHSNYIKEKLIHNFKIKSSKITIIPHGNFDNYLSLKPITNNEAREILGLKDNDNVLLYFGFIREYKGVDLLLNSFNILADKDNNFKLLIAGAVKNPELKLKYLELINLSLYKGRISYNFNFIPSNEVAKYFLAADIVILPYKQIDHSGVIHLAYSFGKPVLTTNVGDFPEMVEENKSGFILKQNTVSELAEKIKEIFQDKSRLIEMGKYAKSVSENKYSWEDIASKTLSLYNKIQNKILIT